MNASDLKDLFRHMRWADAEVWRAVLAAPAARTDETLRKLLLHLHVVQRAFLDVWEGRPLTFPDVSEFPDVAQIQAWASPYCASATQFLDTLDSEALARPVVMPWAEEFARQLGIPPRAPTLAETIFQVTSHSTYHRGQVNSRLRAVGGEPPLVDYIAWVWFGRPEEGSPLAGGGGR
jgi:uncharacterized damage-inducible protein DinB